MEQEVIGILKSVGAVNMDGHFVGTSGRHMSVYLNKDALLPHTQQTSRIGELFAEMNKELPIDVVVAPAMGAVILGHWTAFHLSRITDRDVLSYYTEKEAGGNQIFKRGYAELVSGKNVLVIEDTAATGLSVRRTIQAVREAGGTVVRACAMVNRDIEQITSESINAPLQWLAHIPAVTYAADACPLCAAGIPVNRAVGHGEKFLSSTHVG